MVRKGQIILALSNPNAEIAPEDALKAGAAFAADGRLVNNILGFPGIFRGALNAYAKEITYPMLIAAALAIVDSTKPGDLVPHPLDPNVHQNVAAQSNVLPITESERKPIDWTVRVDRLFCNWVLHCHSVSYN